MPFPYLEILRKAYEMTKTHVWLWVFGLFLGGVSTFNTGSWNLFVSRFERSDIEAAKSFSRDFLSWIETNPRSFTFLILGILIFLLIMVSLAALAYGAVIWAADKLTRTGDPPQDLQKVTFARALRASRQYFWRIIGLQVSITLAFSALFVLIALPIIYLFAVHALERGLVLLLLGLAIILPASLIFGFLHLYGPIFIVLFDRKISDAIGHAFNLVRAKFKESIILSAFLLGLSILFIFIEIFSIILFSVPIALLGWFVLKLGFFLSLQVFSLAGLIMAVGFVIVLNAAFAVFQSVAWVLAVQEMVRTLKQQKEEKALAVEPAQ